MSVWYCNSGILVHVLCNAEKEFGEYGGLVHMADVKDQWIYIKLVDCLEKCLICRHIRRFAD